MKVLAFLLLFLVIPLMAQDAQYWGVNQGRDITWNKSTRFTSDSTDFFGSTPTQLDTVGTDSVFYTDLIITNGDGYEGIFNFTFSVDSISGSDAVYDSVDVYLRRYFEGHTYPWETTWHSIGTDLSCGVTYERQIADSTWWNPSNGFQLKMVIRDFNCDTVGVPSVGNYIR
jgi:hypothetical protein